jgi:HEPN domain-containing protein
MLDDSEFGRWREAAEDALEASRDNTKGGWHNWSCMIAEQAAQLSVKALLHGVGRGG